MTAPTVLVSGGAGFVGQHLVARLKAAGTRVVAPTKAELDLRDADAVRAAVATAQPAGVFHLAAFSSPSLSWDAPADAVLGNVAMSLNLLEAVRLEASRAGVVLVGSGQVYGEPTELPVDEYSPLSPGNPYAVSKASSDMLGAQYADGHGIRVLRMRPFNHSGPGQSDEYVLSSLARQVAEAEVEGRVECLLRTGNPDSARDFTDVRDVVRAYELAIEAESGAYNVCRGSATTVAELVEVIAAQAQVAVRHEVDPARLRTSDAPVLFGSHRRLSAACGWEPEIPLERTVADLLEWWRRRLSR